MARPRGAGWAAQGRPWRSGLFPAGVVVGSFARDGDVMDMAFAQARAGDAHELRLAVEFRDGAATGVPHRGTPASRATLTASMIAVNCGTPTPATTRVVQIEPGPIPTFTASAPASINALAASAVAMLPPATWT